MENAHQSVAEQVQNVCAKAYPNTAFLQVNDHSDGCGAKLEIIIVSDEAFDNVPLIQRHRQVQKVLEDGGFGMDVVHAVTLRTWTVKQWVKAQSK